jgi:hypothetical protein
VDRGGLMSDSARTAASEAGRASNTSTAASRTAVTRPTAIAAVGLALVSLAVGLVVTNYDLGIGGISSGQPTIGIVEQADLDAAASTLAPAVAGGLIDDAKHCRVPLAAITIAKGTAQAGGSIRIRSGSYVSPWFNVSEGSQRLAIPYPAPYGAGSGVLVVEGDATGAILGLTPTKVMLDLPTAESISVVWRPKSPC